MFNQSEIWNGGKKMWMLFAEKVKWELLFSFIYFEQNTPTWLMALSKLAGDIGGPLFGERNFKRPLAENDPGT